MSGPFAFVTLLSSDSYLPGALVLAASLRDLHPTPPVAPEVDFKTVCIVTPETVDVKSIKALRKAFDLVIGVEVLEAENSTGLQLLGRPDLTTAITKLHVFRLTDFSKIIYLDADILPLRPMSHLFLTPHEFSACPDVGWPDIFNSGVMVLEPGEDKFQQIADLYKTKGSWDGADQGLLNEWRGSNWNRLSFTYNTTPTAAYTYAPAYLRFGSSIKAIHFIGQNKPWASIPWRAPIGHPSAESMNSYGYSNLVDRWFAVYDRHYRPPVIATEEEYRVQHYQAAWETSTFDSPTPTIDLDNLRRLAVEGTTISAPVAVGEGEYRSMPLEGRVDLMRPPNENQQYPSAHDAYHSQPDASHGHVDNEYRPPGREGLPSYLYRPPSPAREQPYHHPPADQPHDQDRSHHEHHQVRPSEDYQQQHGGQNQEEHHADYRPRSPPMINWNPALEPPPSHPPPIVGMAFAEQQYSNIWDLAPSRPTHIHHRQEYQDPWIQQPSYDQSHQHRQEEQSHHEPYQQSHEYRPPYEQNRHSHRPHHQNHHHHQQHQEQHSHRHGRRSPHQHYHNAGAPVSAPWTSFYPGNSHSHSQQQASHPSSSQDDRPRHEHGKKVHEQHRTAREHRESRPEDFFHAPAPTRIPTNLVREGHYSAVITDEPKPDRSKVEPIFPWEQRSRPRPKRVFPDWEPPLPRLHGPPQPTVTRLEEALLAAEASEEASLAAGMSEESREPTPIPERRRSPSPPPHVRRKFNRPPSPPTRQGSTYVNAWDTDKSIQRYASVLQGRSSPFSPQPWPTHPGQEAVASRGKKLPPTQEDEEEYTNWADRAEASSRDGDDEDDEEDIALLSPKSAARRRASKEKGNRYRHQGVQTDPKITESRGVQVSILTEASNRPVEDSFMPPHQQANTRPHTSAKPSVIPNPKRVSFASTMSDLSTLVEAPEVLRPAVGHGSPSTPVLRKRESSEDSMTTAAESSIISSPTKESEDAVPPRVQIRSPEVPAVAGRGSGLTGVVRRVGRVFSPTTGIEIFKRGSEEVLARFLMQEPSGWDTTRQGNAIPGTPSANY